MTRAASDWSIPDICRCVIGRLKTKALLPFADVHVPARLLAAVRLAVAGGQWQAAIDVGIVRFVI